MKCASRWLLIGVLSLTLVPCAFAQRSSPFLRDGGDAPAVGDASAPPSPPIPSLLSQRGKLTVERNARADALWAPPPDGDTVFLPLSAGLSAISLPVRTASDKLSDIFPNLPDGARVWTWDAASQKFVEGLDNDLPPGQGCFLYLPVPTILTVTGRINRLNAVSVDLANGWNLVGIPYNQELRRDSQYVYVDQVRTNFNDAVAANAVGSLVYSLDINGYEVVPADGTFQPTHAYWVYASGAQLMELGPTQLGDFGDTWWGWGIKSTGSGIIGGLASYGVSTLLHSMGIGNETQDALNQIAQDLQRLNDNQVKMNNKLDSALQAIEVSKDEIFIKIDEATKVDPLRATIDTHVTDQTPNLSLAWFAAKAKAGEGKSITQATKTTFAKNVLIEWDVPRQVMLLKEAIKDPDAPGDGILDNFAKVIAISATKYDLNSRYLALQSYFNMLLGLQIRASTLIQNAYVTLADDPAESSSYKASMAADYRTQVFDPMIKGEVARFRLAVEKLAAARLQLASKPVEDGVRVPDEVQTILGMADFLAMETLKDAYPTAEPPGLRVRLILNPGAEIPAMSYRPLVSGSAWQSLAVPTADKWYTITGAQTYDDWTLSPTDFPREFTATKDWKMMRIIIPVASAGKYVILPKGKSVWWDPNGFYVGTATILGNNYMPDPSGVLFGSVTIAERPSTSQILTTCFGTVTTQASNNCYSNAYSNQKAKVNPDPTSGLLSPCGTMSIERCMAGDAGASFKMDFTYKGSAPQQATWITTGLFNRGCYHGSYHYQIWEKDQMLNEMWGDWDQSQSYPMTFQPGHTYTFRTAIQGNTDVGLQDCTWTLRNVRPFIQFQ